MVGYFLVAFLHLVGFLSVDEEVAIKLNQKLEGLREQIISEQEEKMRQAIQEAVN